VSDLDELRDAMRTFTAERDWERFHDPKSLLLALVGEVGELTELFQWLPVSEAAELAQHEPLRTRAGEELADVLLYLVTLADALKVDLRVAADRKLALNSVKHRPPSADDDRAHPLGQRPTPS
jgi:dCTP diphosphatase